jgi:hypothetical protein
LKAPAAADLPGLHSRVDQHDETAAPETGKEGAATTMFPQEKRFVSPSLGTRRLNGRLPIQSYDLLRQTSGIAFSPFSDWMIVFAIKKAIADFVSSTFRRSHADAAMSAFTSFGANTVVAAALSSSKRAWIAISGTD